MEVDTRLKSLQTKFNKLARGVVAAGVTRVGALTKKKKSRDKKTVGTTQRFSADPLRFPRRGQRAKAASQPPMLVTQDFLCHATTRRPRESHKLRPQAVDLPWFCSQLSKCCAVATENRDVCPRLFARWRGNFQQKLRTRVEPKSLDAQPRYS